MVVSPCSFYSILSERNVTTLVYHNKGTETAKCTRCDKTDTRPVKALGHAYDNGVVTTEPTCENEGVMTFTCTREGCTNSYIESIPAIGHEFGDWFYASEDDKPTCTEKGLETRKCIHENCNKTETQEVDALGHDLKEEIITPATCETTGSKKVTCTRGGCTYEEIVEIPAKGHAWNDGEITTPPTCTTDGVKTFTCQNDPSHTKTEVVKATGHDLKEEVVKPATCTEKGQVRVFCTQCDFEEIKETESFGHDLKEEVIKAPTCTEKGEIKVTCSNCDFEEIKYTDALGHNMVDGESTLPTCLTNGLTSKRCTRCDHHEDTVIPALGHHWTDVAEKGHWDITTVYEERYICNGCGASFEDIEDIMIHTSDVCGTGYRVGKVPIEKKTWVVDVPAYKECDRCHVTQ